ncbi:MAG: glycosyl hydrolase [Bacteroidota bacterium]
MAFSKKLVDGETLNKENFISPPKEMGILPFWFWNGEMDEKEMEWQMSEYHAKGIPGLFIHGRFGEKIGYLSEIWMEKTKFAVEKAKEIGIDIWVYDEMNWPSGTAYRKVPQENPELRQKYLEVCALPVPGPLFTFLEATDDRYVNTGNSKPIAAFACSEEEFKTQIKSLLDLTPNLSFNAVIPWEAPEGNWRLLYFLEKEIDYYIDALNPASTKKFLEETHEKYKTAVGKDFGTIVPGFYTDEPAMHYYHVGMANQIIPWTKQMFKIFRDKRGYDLKPYLPALFFDMGEQTSKIRYDFWRTLTEQYSESYYKQIREWCESNGVLFTGHLLGEEWMWMHARCEGNIFKHLQHMHITGVDHLYPVIGTEEMPDQHVAIKIASSAAHHFGSTRLLCESMGGTYWDCTLERMKWIANWEYALGVNIFNNHGYHYSIEGERKRDWPPSQFYHHTWWKYYNYFTEYMARLGHLLSGGKHIAKILVLYPINSAWTNYQPSGANDIFNLMQAEFNFLTDALLRLHYDFDYVDEDVLNEAAIVKDKIIIRDEEYSMLILPPVTHIKESTFKTIKKFVKGGGKVLADSLLPEGLLEYEKKDAVKLIEKFFGIEPSLMKKKFQSGSKPCLVKNQRENIFVVHGEGLHKQRDYKLLGSIIGKCITPDVTISDKDVFYLHREKDGFDIYYFVNTTRYSKKDVVISFEKIGTPELWNANTGSIVPLHVFKIVNGRLFVKIDFAAADSVIVQINNMKPVRYIKESNIVVESYDGSIITGYSREDIKKVSLKIVDGNNERTLSSTVVNNFPPIQFKKEFDLAVENDNTLLVSDWKMKISNDEDDYSSAEFDDAEWLKVTIGAWEMQLPQERDEASYPETLWYRSKFEIEKIPDRLVLLVDGFSGKEYKLYINGKKIEDKGKRSNLDAEIKEVDIKNYVKEGVNTVALRLVVTRRTDGILDLLKIAGDFSLREKGNGYSIAARKEKIKVGDWTKQGYPYFSGTAVLKQTINIPQKYLCGKLFLEAGCGEDVLEVIVNDCKPIVIPWHPYSIDISNLVVEGDNKIILKVTNTLINVLEAVKKESGVLVSPKITHAQKYQLSL